ncbi:MAG: PP2C family protein-serine/threonine phosphatase [Planctomycetes bacterium]|nr:PP2C family protein-serine/threonine phosphatase [Planctomycetota bacterium]
MKSPRPQRPGARGNPGRQQPVSKGAPIALDRYQINQWLDHDPLFQVLTVDRMAWIDPFSGTILSAQTGHHREIARRHLQKNRPWLRFTLRTMEDLQGIRWAHYLRNALESEGRLRIFRKDGLWLNPFSGEWIPAVNLEHGKITQETMMDMARQLSRCHSAESGKMLDRAQLGQVIQRTSSVSDRLQAVNPNRTKTPSPESIQLPERELELHQARKVLDRMLPPLPVIPGWDVAVIYQPHSFIGGDFYEIIQLDESRYFIAIGDVTGHGPGAALVVASTLKALRYAVRHRAGGGGLANIVSTFNDDIKDMLLRSCFITMFAAILDVEEQSLTCVCAGHHPAILASLKGDITLRQIGEPGPAIGVMDGETFRSQLEPMSIELHQGDTLVLFTDGLFEVFDKQQDEFGRHRVMASCLAHVQLPCEKMLQGLLTDVKAFAGAKLPDDTTALAIRLGDPGE